MKIVKYFMVLLTLCSLSYANASGTNERNITFSVGKGITNGRVFIVRAGKAEFSTTKQWYQIPVREGKSKTILLPEKKLYIRSCNTGGKLGKISIRKEVGREQLTNYCRTTVESKKNTQGFFRRKVTTVVEKTGPIKLCVKRDTSVSFNKC